MPKTPAELNRSYRARQKLPPADGGNEFTLWRIKSYFETHLCSTRKEAARDLNLAHNTINRYVALIRQEWKSKPDQPDALPTVEQRLAKIERMLTI